MLPPPAPAPDASGTLAEHFSRRLAARDAPPPSPSQEPAAVLARLATWARTDLAQRNTRTCQRLAQLLLLLMQHPEATSAQLQAAIGLRARATTRLVQRLLALHVLVRERRGPFYYHRLTRSAEDALLLVVAGPVGG